MSNKNTPGVTYGKIDNKGKEYIINGDHKNDNRKESIAISKSGIDIVEVPWNAKLLHVPDHVRIVRVDSNMQPINNRRGNNEDEEQGKKCWERAEGRTGASRSGSW